MKVKTSDNKIKSINIFQKERTSHLKNYGALLYLYGNWEEVFNESLKILITVTSNTAGGQITTTLFEQVNSAIPLNLPQDALFELGSTITFSVKTSSWDNSPADKCTVRLEIDGDDFIKFDSISKTASVSLKPEFTSIGYFEVTELQDNSYMSPLIFNVTLTLPN